MHTRVRQHQLLHSLIYLFYTGFRTRLDCGRLENRVLIYQKRFVGVNLTGTFIRERSNDCGGLDLINDLGTRRLFDVHLHFSETHTILIQM